MNDKIFQLLVIRFLTTIVQLLLKAHPANCGIEKLLEDSDKWMEVNE